MPLPKRVCPFCADRVELDPRGWPTHMRFKHNLKTKAAIERAINAQPDEPIEEYSDEQIAALPPILDNSPTKPGPMAAPFAITNAVGQFIEQTYINAGHMRTQLERRRFEIQTELQEIDLMLDHLKPLTTEPPDFVEEAESKSTAA